MLGNNEDFFREIFHHKVLNVMENQGSFNKKAVAFDSALRQSC